MEPLFIFETPNKKPSNEILIDRINDSLLPELKSIGFKCEIHKIKQLGETPIVKIIYNKKSILVMSWVRPFSDNKTMNRTLNDYPRLNIQSELLKKSDETKINEMYDLVSGLNLYFLVMLQRQHENLFWFDKYSYIPKDYWKTTYRKKGVNDRIHFPKYKNTNFIKLNDLKSQIQKSMRNEN